MKGLRQVLVSLPVSPAHYSAALAKCRFHLFPAPPNTERSYMPLTAPSTMSSDAAVGDRERVRGIFPTPAKPKD